MTGRVRIGAATGWARDRFEPAADLVARGNLDYLCFDSMSEITMSAAQVQRLDDERASGFDPYLAARLEPILAECHRQRVRIITNQGWLNPEAAARSVLDIARRLGLPALKVGVVRGGDITDRVADIGLRFVEDGMLVSARRHDIVSAEVYLGAAGIIRALEEGADVVITGRVADGCLYLAPLAHALGWELRNTSSAATGMIVGHLMECAAQVTGGYFADPGYKDVPDLHALGNPIVDVDGSRIVISKLAGTGGCVSEATCKEQLLYEVDDPSAYYCPDVVADLSCVRFRQAGENAVEVIIGENPGRTRPPTLKALVGLRDGCIAEEFVLFAGPGARARADLTKDVLLRRLAAAGLHPEQVRTDYIGIDSVHRESSPVVAIEPYEVVLRVAVRTRTRAEAEALRREVDPLAVNGVAGTGKAGTSYPGGRVRAVIDMASVLIPRTLVTSSVRLLDLSGLDRVVRIDDAMNPEDGAAGQRS